MGGELVALVTADTSPSRFTWPAYNLIVLVAADAHPRRASRRRLPRPVNSPILPSPCAHANTLAGLRSPLSFANPSSQGAAAAGTFSSKGIISGAYADGSEYHKTSEQVEAHWYGVLLARLSHHLLLRPPFPPSLSSLVSSMKAISSPTTAPPQDKIKGDLTMTT